MSEYVEQSKDYALRITADGIRGTRGFVTKTGGADSLPAIGDSFSASYAACIAKEIEIRKFGSHPAIDRAVVTYATPGSEGGGGSSPSGFDDTPTRFQLGGEVLSIQNSEKKPSGVWTWEDAGTAVAQPMFRQIGTGKFLKTIEVADADLSLFKQYARSHRGKINGQKWQDYPLGTLLFNGSDGVEKYDEGGARFWRVKLEFLERSIPDVSYDDWQYAFNIETGAWDRPLESGAPVYAYENMDLLFFSK